MWLFGLYVAGVLVGLVAVDGPLATKVGLAAVWPLGVLAFAATIAVLVAVGAVAFPSFGVLMAAALIGAWLWL